MNFFCIAGAAAQSGGQDSAPHFSVIPAIEQTERYLPLLRGKKLALVANHSSLIGGKRSLDVLLSKGVHITRVFGPEHGFAGTTSANTAVGHRVDSATGTPVVSLFGDHYAPTPADLEGVDIMLFDMQDVGVRFYTYISTLHYVMEACARKGIPLVVCDRPNPNDGYIDGPVLEQGFQSFIGMHPVPMVYGLTIGEYAGMINGQGWLGNGARCKLTVIPLQQYRHGLPFRFTVPPSPNLNTLRSIYLYPSLCWFGATAISDARGTLFPFQAIGSPAFSRVFGFSFVPGSIAGMSENPKHLADTCYGIDLRNYPVAEFGVGGRLNLQWLLDMYQAYPDKQHFFNGTPEASPGKPLHFDQLAGNSSLRRQIGEGKTEAEIRSSWEAGLLAYKKMRKKYLLYPDPVEPVRIMSYNIHHGADKDEKNTLLAMADFIKGSGADIVGLQEVDSVCARSGKTDQAATLAARLGIHQVFVRHFDFEEGAYGIALLSRYPMHNIQRYRLPVDPSATTSGVAFFTADLTIKKKQVIRVAVVHMDYRSQASRIRQAGIVRQLLQDSRLPVVLIGDMNASPRTPEIDTLSQSLENGGDYELFTFPAEKANRKIDYIFLGGRFERLYSKVYEVGFSDHLPFMSVVQLPVAPE